MKDKSVEILFNWLRVDHPLQKSDLIVGCGSYDLRSAEHAAQLWLDGWAPGILFSGGLGNFTDGIFNEPEADIFARHAIEMGVPEDCILIENESTNSGENIIFSKALIEKKGLNSERLILVQKPNMMRRVFASWTKQWSGPEYICSSMNLKFSDVPHGHMTADKVIDELCGDFQRIVEYPKLGFQTEQKIPDEVRAAWEFLVAEGHTGHLMK